MEKTKKDGLSLSSDLKPPVNKPKGSDETKEYQTYGLELVIIGVVSFIAIIAFTILTYKVFIRDRVKSSAEYNTATYFVVNSETLKEHLLSPMEAMRFKDLRVSEKDNYGICEITFELFLKNGLVEHLRLGLVKVADFWLVYQARLSPDTPSEYLMVSTYQKILMMLERLDYQDAKTAQIMLKLLKKEVRDPNLMEYLSARVNAMDGNTTFARQILSDLSHRVGYGRLAVEFERAMVYFSEREYKKATDVFEVIVKDYEAAKAKEDRYSRARSIFSGLPKDPFIAAFSHDNILADTYKNMALAYYEQSQYQKGLDYAEKAIDQAQKNNSKVVYSSANFIKAMNLFRLKRFDDADQSFKLVIQDLDNNNLSQKAWAYYYRADIAARFSRHQAALDYYETAVNLDPFNYLLRKGAIDYLLNRNLAGDLEVALSLSLRGISYEVEKSFFQDRAAQIYARLGLRDKSRAID